LVQPSAGTKKKAKNGGQKMTERLQKQPFFCPSFFCHPFFLSAYIRAIRGQFFFPFRFSLRLKTRADLPANCRTISVAVQLKLVRGS
jgi:hypothetical protein